MPEARAYPALPGEGEVAPGIVCQVLQVETAPGAVFQVLSQVLMEELLELEIMPLTLLKKTQQIGQASGDRKRGPPPSLLSTNMYLADQKSMKYVRAQRDLL